MDIPVTVTTHDIEVTVSETVVDVLVTATVQTIAVTVEYGLSSTQVQLLLTKENITGLKETDSPQFTDTTIPALNSVTNGGEVPDVDYNWFKSVYASLVDDSVKSWIIGIITFLKELTDRVTTLENDIINYSISVPEDVSSVDITGINAPKGSTIMLAIDFIYSVNTPASTYNMLFDGITAGYRNGGLSTTNNIIIYSPLSEGSQYISTIYVSEFIIVNGLSIRKAVGSNPVHLLLVSSLPSLADSSITKITIRTTESNKVIAAGTKINIKVLK